MSIVSVSRRAGPPHFGHVRVHEFWRARQRRFPFARDRNFFRQHHRQAVVRNGNHATLVAIHHGNRRPPISLAGNSPISQAVSRLTFAEAAASASAVIFSSATCRASCRCKDPNSQACRNRVKASPARTFPRPESCAAADDYNRNRQFIFRAEFKIALVVRGHGHNRAGAVFHQHEIPYPDRQLFACERIDRVLSGEKSNFLRGGEIFGLHGGLPHRCELRFSFSTVAEHSPANFLATDGRRENNRRRAINRVDARSENFDRFCHAIHRCRIARARRGFSDPVPLHGDDALGPTVAQFFEIIEQFFRVLRDPEKPLLQVSRIPPAYLRDASSSR